MDKVLRPKLASVATIDWDVDRCSSLASSNRHMLETEDGCDVTLVVKGQADKSETRMAAHRYVLCSRSPEFYRLLWAGKAINEKKLKVTDTTAEVMRQVIRFLYCEEADLDVGIVIPVLHAAHRYQVHSLTTKCVEFVEGNLSADNVCSLLEQCVEFDDQTMVDCCTQFIARHTTDVLRSEAYIRSSVEVVCRIASLDTLSVDEIELFEACVAWATARGGSDSEELRRHLSPLLELIRFPTMSPEDFARRVVCLNILSDSEACNVYKYFTCPEKPPKRFITVKRKRPISSPAKSPCQLYPNVDQLKLRDESNGEEFNGDALPSAPDLLPEYDGTQPPPEYEHFE